MMSRTESEMLIVLTILWILDKPEEVAAGTSFIMWVCYSRRRDGSWSILSYLGSRLNSRVFRTVARFNNNRWWSWCGSWVVDMWQGWTRGLGLEWWSWKTWSCDTVVQYVTSSFISRWVGKTQDVVEEGYVTRSVGSGRVDQNNFLNGSN